MTVPELPGARARAWSIRRVAVVGGERPGQ
jgi:hypothetical protein